MKVKVKKLHLAAILPTCATPGAACFDLHAITPEPLAVDYFEPATFRTGLAFEIPEGHAMLIFSRSGHGFKYDTRLANCVGVIDSDYRGEVAVRLTRDANENGHEVLSVKTGDRIAQAMIVPVPRVEFDMAYELSNTARGAGGFGSTGA